jgi:hypothetical protein
MKPASKRKTEPIFQAALIFGFGGTPAIVDPYLPVPLRLVLASFLLLGTSFGVAQVLFRFAGLKLFKEKSRFSQTVDGIGAGVALGVLLLTILNFYFGVHITVPSL